LVKSRVGSPWGTKDELRTILCPFSSKNLRKAERMSLPLQNFGRVWVPVTYASICQVEQSSLYRRRDERGPATGHDESKPSARVASLVSIAPLKEDVNRAT
jgi:hypothetical protein